MRKPSTKASKAITAPDAKPNPAKPKTVAATKAAPKPNTARLPPMPPPRNGVAYTLDDLSPEVIERVCRVLDRALGRRVVKGPKK